MHTLSFTQLLNDLLLRSLLLIAYRTNCSSIHYFYRGQQIDECTLHYCAACVKTKQVPTLEEEQESEEILSKAQVAGGSKQLIAVFPAWGTL